MCNTLMLVDPHHHIHGMQQYMHHVHTLACWLPFPSSGPPLDCSHCHHHSQHPCRQQHHATTLPPPSRLPLSLQEPVAALLSSLTSVQDTHHCTLSPATGSDTTMLLVQPGAGEGATEALRGAGPAGDTSGAQGGGCQGRVEGQGLGGLRDVKVGVGEREGDSE